MAKVWYILAYIVNMYIGGIALHFSTWCIPVGAWKFQFVFWGYSPKILELAEKNLDFHFATLTWFKISSNCNNIS